MPNSLYAIQRFVVYTTKHLTATASKKESVILIVILCLYIQNSWPRRLLPPIHFCSIQHPVQDSSSRTQDSVCLPRKLDRSLHFSLASRRMRIHLMKAQMVIPAIPILFASTLVKVRDVTSLIPVVSSPGTGQVGVRILWQRPRRRENDTPKDSHGRDEVAAAAEKMLFEGEKEKALLP